MRRRAQAGVPASIAETRKAGEIEGIKDRITVLQGNMTNLWNNTENGTAYTALGDAVEDGELVLTRIRELLDELKILEPGVHN